MSIKLYHYSSKPLKKILKRNYLEKFWFIQECNKPQGFWLSVEDTADPTEQNWGSFCNNKVMQYRIKYKYEISIHPNANILVIESAPALKEFVRMYGFHKIFHESHAIEEAKKMKKELQIQRNKAFSNFPAFQSLREELDDIEIDWWTLYKNYHGIQIAPYQNALRYKWLWYYGWDVASACIWDLGVINSFLLEEK